MSTYESHPALQISYKGETGQACQAFIDHVIEYAIDNNKQGDDEWIADFAGMRLRGEALTWFTELDNETQESWRRLRKALVRAFRPTSNTTVTSYRSTASSSTSPTPAAAAPTVPATIPVRDLNAAFKLRKGLIRIVSDEPGLSGYVSEVSSKGGSLTRVVNVADATTVEFSLSGSARPHEIKLMGTDGSPKGLMGLHWGTEPRNTSDTLSWGRIANLQLVDGQYTSQIKNFHGPANPFTWLALMDGSLVAVHRDKNSVQHVVEIYVLEKTGSLCFGLVFENIRSHHAKSQNNTVVSRARLVFEAT